MARFPRPLLPAVLVAATVTCAAFFALRGEAQDSDATAYVSGLRIGKRAQAIVRLHNASRHPGDTYSVHYTVRHTEAGQSLSLPGAGDGARLSPGQTIELDLETIVNQYRATFGVGGFDGPVQFVAFGTGGVNPFGAETVSVEAVQVEGAAKFEPLVEWR